MQDTPKPKLTLVLGGARSGKSRYAQQLAAEQDRVLFLATAVAGDAEMTHKIGRHRADRLRDGLHWTVIEETLQLGKRIETTAYGLILVDCLTLFVGNLLFFNTAKQKILIDNFCEALLRRSCPVVLVSNEVGSGIVPAFASGRQYRETLGELNQRVAAMATDVVLMVAGLPLPLKSDGAR